MRTKLIIFLAMICVMIIPTGAFGSSVDGGLDVKTLEVAPVEGEGLMCNDVKLKDEGNVKSIKTFTIAFQKTSSTKAMAIVRAKTDKIGISSTSYFAKEKYEYRQVCNCFRIHSI